MRAIQYMAVMAGAAALVAAGEAQGAVSPLATPADYYYTVPKTTNVFGRVMGENGDYRLVRNEDISFINEAWEERKSLAGSGPSMMGWNPGGTLVRRRNWPSWIECYAATNLSTCVVTGATMEARLAEASGGAMTNVRYQIARRSGLVSMAAVTNEFATLKKRIVLADMAEESYTNEQATVVTTHTRFWGDERSGETNQVTVLTNAIERGRWAVEGYGSHTVKDGIVVEDGKGRAAGERWWDKETDNEQISGRLKMRMEFRVYNTNDWMRGEASPRVVKSAHAYAVVEAWGGRSRERRTYEVRETGQGWGWVTNSYEKEEWTTNATVLVDMGEARWVECRDGRLVYELPAKRVLDFTQEVLAEVEGMPSLEEVAAAGVVPEMEEVGEQFVSKWISCEILSVYVVMEIKPVTSLPGW